MLLALLCSGIDMKNSAAVSLSRNFLLNYANYITVNEEAWQDVKINGIRRGWIVMLAACLLSLVGVVLYTANNSYLILLTAGPVDFCFWQPCHDTAVELFRLILYFSQHQMLNTSIVFKRRETPSFDQHRFSMNQQHLRKETNMHIFDVRVSYHFMTLHQSEFNTCCWRVWRKVYVALSLWRYFIGQLRSPT